MSPGPVEYKEGLVSASETTLFSVFNSRSFAMGRRYAVNKAASAANFKKKVSKTKALNMRGPMRGGIRL